MNGLLGMMSNKLEKHIRCKCGNLYGLKNFRRKGVCRRCKTPVIARGEIGNNKIIKGVKK